MGDKAAAKKLMSEANNDFKALCFHKYFAIYSQNSVYLFF